MKTSILMATLFLNTCIMAQSSFNKVSSILRDENVELTSKKAEKEYETYQNGNWPSYSVTTLGLMRKGVEALISDAKRTVSQKDDFYPRLEKFVHPNGACLSGTWEITESSKYTGAFQQGFNGLYIGRVSTTMTHTKRGKLRGFGHAGKIFPTSNPSETVKTENFFSVDVLMGTKANRYLDVATTNEPDLGFDFSSISLGLRIAKAFTKADENPGFRPLYNLAGMGVKTEDVVSPKWIRIAPAAGTLKNDEVDFRDEVVKAVEENGILLFDIFVSDTTKDRNSVIGWQKLGQIKIDQSYHSYSCDRRLHFAHPKLKE